MSDAVPLLVPLTVEALVVNDDVRLDRDPTSRKAFMRTQMQYGALQECVSGQPVIGDNDLYFTRTGLTESGVPTTDFYDGVYLKWRMPDALTRGAHDPVTGVTTYPPVPNRWLVVRMNGAETDRQARAWIIESDFVWKTPPPSGTVAGLASFYVGEQQNLPEAIRIGRNVELGTWTESGDSLHLTAVAPGNPAFAFYQPHNNNVFSFVDVLADGPDDTLSYQVLGWFSDAGDDPLAGVDAQDFAARLDALGWTLQPGTDPTLTTRTTFLTGSVCGVTWQTGQLPPGGTPGGTTPIAVSVGNTSVEALTALVATQAQALADTSVDADLLEAFQLGLLDVLDEPDGAAILAERLQAGFFQRFSGGYDWTIVDAPGSTETLSPGERARESEWLANLRADQKALDDALRELAALQTLLYTAWWKYVSQPWLYTGKTSVPGLQDQTALESLIDPAVQGSVGQRTAAQLRTVQALAALVPDGATPEALQQAIAAFSALRDLPASRVLKRTSAAPFHLPNNPVVLISGAGAAGIVGPGGPALCRFPSQLVTAFACGGTTVSASTQGLTIAQPGLSGVSGAPWTDDLVAGLVNEFFLTDPANATAISAVIPGSTPAEVLTAMGDPASYTGVYPEGGVLTWTRNPWHPLLLMWEATYYPIAYGTPDAPNWTLQDGAYVWNGTPQSVEQPRTLSGLIQLSSTASLTMESRIQAFLRDDPSLAPQEAEEFEALLGFVQTQDSWDLLSQSLDGFNEQIRLGMPGVFLGPGSAAPATDPPLPVLIGGADEYPPYLPLIPSDGVPASLFQPWRAGQFAFDNLVLVDEWGQALWPIGGQPKGTEIVYRPDDLLPVYTSEQVLFTITDGQAEAPAPADASGPVITGLSPDLIQAGMAPSARIPVTVSGSGFGTDSVVRWDGTALTATVNGDDEIVCSVPATFVMEPGAFDVTVESGGVTSPQAVLTVSAGPAIGTLDPSSAVAGSAAFTLTATGVGFAPQSMLAWNGSPLQTAYVSPTELTAQVTADLIAQQGMAYVTEIFGHQCVTDDSADYVQLPPALLQPARLDFTLSPATDDRTRYGAEADPVCGWVLPNHLDASLIAYDATGTALGEMSVGYDLSDQPAVHWVALPGSPYTTLHQIARAIPHFGPFLLALKRQEPATFTAFLGAVDETLWTTAPMGAVFDHDLAVLMGRPIAMVRARLRFELDGPPYADPSWQYTFDPAPPVVTGYEFPIELGDLARLGDGLIGYFTGDDYTHFNVVQQAVRTSSSYLTPIGVDGNYVYLPFDSTTAAYVSMLVDPRAAVHATTGLLPTARVALPPRFVTDALAAMDVTFRVNGGLTDQTISAAGATTVLMPVPKERTGTWSWTENDAGTWTSYATGPNDTTARLPTVAPVLRRGLLQLSAALGDQEHPRPRPGR
ncbi:IPT/TIG domain-containing protein [Nonomuraea sp. NPDC005692]|uniref:IPT/TIG domain-containing protein n=1 Tax=Nonomuraea sp. NPDC005692 TaxID=3157168 RepID=UPI0033E381D1